MSVLLHACLEDVDTQSAVFLLPIRATKAQMNLDICAVSPEHLLLTFKT